jgi:hypothetical protein
MRSVGRRGVRGQLALLGAMVFVVGPLVPAATAAAGQGAPPPASPHVQQAPDQRGSGPSGTRLRASEEEKKVTICHRTASRTNPYNEISIAKSAAIAGHADHTGPIFDPEDPGQKHWGDIIPPIRPGLPDGLNWPEGRSIRNNHCEMEPDVGPVPRARVGDLGCVGTSPSLTVKVGNSDEATQPAFFEILIDGSVVQVVGPVAPGASEIVVLSTELQPYEDQTVAIEVRSGGDVIASRVVTVDCVPPPPQVETDAELVCGPDGAQGRLTVTNNKTIRVVVGLRINGKAVGVTRVRPGAIKTGTIDLSQYEDQSVTATVRVNGVLVATYTVTPDCVAPQPVPGVSVAGTTCPPPTSTVTLSNHGDPDSQMVFVIMVDQNVALKTAPLYGGDTTTVVADLAQYEDQTVTVSIHANGRLLGSRTITVDCKGPGSGVSPGTTGPIGPSRGNHPANRDGAPTGL